MAADTWKRLNSPLRTLLVAIVARTIFFWYSLRYAQCGWLGVEVSSQYALRAVTPLTISL